MPNGRANATGYGGRVGLHTFGCKLNQFETEALAAALREQGFSVTTSREDAEVHVVNSCTVTTRADHKTRALVRKLAHDCPESLVVVTGCSAQLEGRALSALATNVVVIPQSRKAALLQLPSILTGQPGVVERRAALSAAVGAERSSAPFAFVASTQSFHTRAFLKIQDGCDGRCSYCRVALARGPSVSLEPDEAVRRAVAVEAMGGREIVLTGVNIAAYATAGTDLGGLLSRLLEATSRVRLRLSSLEPDSIDERLAAVLADPRICPHFHLPVQSGSDTVLDRMRRRYRAERVKSGVALLREAKTDPFVAADMIVGFPGESEEEFAESQRLVEELRFAALHVFPFSPRPGTAAAEMRPVVPERIRSARAAILNAKSRAQSAEYARCWIGREIEALLERARPTTASGTTANYLKVNVSDMPPTGAAAGRMARVRILSVSDACEASFIDFSA